jgi:hypothetical protein
MQRKCAPPGPLGGAAACRGPGRYPPRVSGAAPREAGWGWMAEPASRRAAPGAGAAADPPLPLRGISLEKAEQRAPTRRTPWGRFEEFPRKM